MSQTTFDIAIPNDRLKIYKLITFIILSLNFFGFGFVFFKTTSTESFLSIFLLIINAVPWCYYLLNKKHIKSPIVETTLIVSAFMWLYLGNLWMGLFLLVFVVIGFFANKNPIIHFSQEGITYPSFPPKKYTWAEITQIVWKDDVLTIDLKNNKLLQFNIEKDFATGFDFVAFNVWCAALYQRIVF